MGHKINPDLSSRSKVNRPMSVSSKSELTPIVRLLMIARSEYILIVTIYYFFARGPLAVVL